MNVETKVPGSRKILMVDDNLVIQRTVSLALKNKGYQVFTAGDISVALSTLRREKPDLILSTLLFRSIPEMSEDRRKAVFSSWNGSGVHPKRKKSPSSSFRELTRQHTRIKFQPQASSPVFTNR